MWILSTAHWSLFRCPTGCPPSYGRLPCTTKDGSVSDLESPEYVSNRRLIQHVQTREYFSRHLWMVVSSKLSLTSYQRPLTPGETLEADMTSQIAGEDESRSY